MPTSQQLSQTKPPWPQNNSIRRIDIASLRDKVAELLTASPGGALVFDADGTLWSHDVGSTVFEEAYLRGALRPSARRHLLGEARALGLQPKESASVEELAEQLQHAFLNGTYGAKATSEMQVWAYIDFTEAELRALCHKALTDDVHSSRLHHEILELIKWAQAQGAKIFVISASPRIVVEEAVTDLGIPRQRIAAGEPNWNDTRIQHGLSAPLPYGTEKALAGRRLLGDLPWLATFGDSGFDLAMMYEAKLAVGIGHKPELVTGLENHPHAFLLDF